MNIKQAKQRFTQLTDLPATKKSVYTAIWKYKGYLADFMQFAFENKLIESDDYDARYADYWIALVTYLESLGGNK